MKEDSTAFLSHRRLDLLRKVWASILLAAAGLVVAFILLSLTLPMSNLLRVVLFGLVVFASLALVISRVSSVFATPTRTAEVALSELSGQLEKTEGHLSQEAARVRAIWDNVVDGLVTINARGEITAANPATCEIFGYSEADLIGKNVKILAAGEDRMRHDAYVESFNRTGRAKIIGRPRKVVGRRSDGSDFPVDLAVAEMRAGADRHFIGVLRDLTDQTALEDQLRHSQRLEAVGQLTGGIAHDFNNLLAVIEGNLGLLVPDLQDRPGEVPEDALELSEGALHAAKRGAELTQGLLAFSRKQALRPQEFDPNQIVGRMEPLLRRTLGETVDLQLSMNTRGWQAEADPAQFESAVLNLIVNARDAMGEGGSLIIETSSVTLDDHYAATHDEVTPGDYVLVTVSDNGPGMPPEILARVLEPFFTTKEVGQGSGLGLSMIYGFAKQTGGHLSIYSEVGEGTSVKLYVPRAQSKSAVASPTKSERPNLNGEGSILVVEDDEALRMTVSRILKRLGYTLTLAEDGPEALRCLDGGVTFDLLLTDVVLPQGMNGPELAAKINEERPEMKVLYMSGYTKEAMVQSGRLDASDYLINKPFSPRELGEKVQDTIKSS